MVGEYAQEVEHRVLEEQKIALLVELLEDRFQQEYELVVGYTVELEAHTMVSM